MTVVDVPADLVQWPKFSDGIPCRLNPDEWSGVYADQAAEAILLCQTACPTVDFDRCQKSITARVAAGEKVSGEVHAGVFYHARGRGRGPGRPRKQPLADVVDEWVAERTIPGGATVSTVLHRDFTDWCKERAVPACGAPQFTAALARLGHAPVGHARRTGVRASIRPLTLKAVTS